jgi:hypothetical protein
MICKSYSITRFADEDQEEENSEAGLACKTKQVSK